MHLSVIIVNFNTLSITCNCIDSLIRNFTDDFKYEIILVDNAPKQSYQETFLTKFPKLIYLRSDTNVGFGQANNLGMAYANGEFYLLLNSDTIVHDDSIQRCVCFMQRPNNVNTGMLGCKLLNPDGTYQASFYPFIKNKFIGYFISNNPVLHKIFRISNRYKESQEIKKVGDISGAFMLLRRTVVDKVKDFDPDFFLYSEETEWCRNRISKDFDIVYYPRASIIHLGGQSAPHDIMYIQSQISNALYWYKTGFILYFLFILYNYANFLYYSIQYVFSNKEVKTTIKKYLNAIIIIQPYLFKDILKYGRAYGSRKEPLIYNAARSIFFDNAIYGKQQDK